MSASPEWVLTARRVAEELRAGKVVTDSLFDEIYPLPIRTLASTYWTPVSVALRATRMLVKQRGSRVLDIGSGVGKLCLIGALTSEGRFFGVEQRETLVTCAREAATLLSVPRVTFIPGVFEALNPADYDAFYLFNPFAENNFCEGAQFDRTVELSRERFSDDVSKARRFLEAARAGSRVVTYNGMGGALPRGYGFLERERMGCMLEAWVKRT